MKLSAFRRTRKAVLDWLAEDDFLEDVEIYGSDDPMRPALIVKARWEIDCRIYTVLREFNLAVEDHWAPCLIRRCLDSMVEEAKRTLPKRPHPAPLPG